MTEDRVTLTWNLLRATWNFLRVGYRHPIRMFLVVRADRSRRNR